MNILALLGVLYLAGIALWTLARLRWAAWTQAAVGTIVGSVAALLIITQFVDLVPDELEELLAAVILVTSVGIALMLWFMADRVERRH